MDLADYIPISVARHVLGVSAVQVGNFCRAGRIAGAVKLGGVWLLPRAEVEAFARRPRPRGNPCFRRENRGYLPNLLLGK